MSTKRKVLKKKISPEEIINVKVSTNDKNSSLNNSLSRSIASDYNNNINNNNIDTNQKDPLIDKNLSSAENNNILKGKLKSLLSYLAKEKESSIEEYQLLNGQLESQKLEINQLCTENKSLISELNTIRQDVNSHLDLAKIFQKKEEKLKEIEKNLLIQIKSMDKRKQTIFKNQEVEKKQIENLQKLLESNNEETEEILVESLANYHSKILSLENEIISLKHVQSIHKNCKKKNSYLKSRLNVYSNEIQFETKKSLMIETEIENKTIENKKKINKLTNPNEEDPAKEYSERIRCKTLTHNKQKNMLINKTAMSPLWKEFDIANGNYQRNSGEVLRKKEVGKMTKKNLFTNDEAEVLEKIVPEGYLASYQEKYNDLENQMNQIKEKFRKNEEIKGEINHYKKSINFSELKLKQQAKIKCKLRVDANKSKKEANDLNADIKSLTKLLNAQNLLLKNKNKENIELKKHIKELKRLIREGKLKPINNDQDNEKGYELQANNEINLDFS